MGLMGNLGKMDYLVGFQVVQCYFVKILVFRVV